MKTTSRQHAINHLTVALSQEMLPPSGSRHDEFDTLFLACAHPSADQRTALASFGLRKNYNLIIASFDDADPAGGPAGIEAVVTDGRTQAFNLSGGRLWRRDRRTPSVLLFPELRAMVRISSKRRLVVGPMNGRHAEDGYEIARQGVLERAKREPGHVPVLTPIGDLAIVVDVRAVAGVFAMGE